MARTAERRRGLTVAVTGAFGDLGRLLLPLLEQDPEVEAVLALDLIKPPNPGPKVKFRRIDLSRHDAEAELSEILSEQRVDAFYHLAFLWSPVSNPALAHELEVIGSIHVLTAVANARIPKLVLPSVTAVYGAHPAHAAVLTEASPLHGCPSSRFVSDKLEVEHQADAFRPHHPDTNVIVLRFAPILGPSVNNPVTRFLRARLVPTLLGFDPLWQAVHEEDAAQALYQALHSEVSGTFNVVGRGVLPLSSLVRMAGGRVLPLPELFARGALRALNAVGSLAVPSTLLNYIHFSWVADGTRAEEALGFVPRFHTRDAVAALKRL